MKIMNLIPMTLVSILFVQALAHSAQACSIFAVSDGENVLAGNNEDDPFIADFMNPKITFSTASEQRRYGSMFYSFDDNYPQGGMNTEGLFFDINSLSDKDANGTPIVAKYPEGTPDFAGPPEALLKHMLSSSGTVSQAVALLQQYKLPGIETGQIFVADRYGAAAVLGVGKNDGRIAVTYKSGNFLLSTNFNLNNPSVNFPEPRFTLAKEAWRANPEVSKRNVLKLLGAIHFEGPSVTVYSNLYDLKRAEMLLYYFHNYADPVRIDLKAELQKRGDHAVKIQDLFPVKPFSLSNTSQLMDYITQCRAGKCPASLGGITGH